MHCLVVTADTNSDDFRADVFLWTDFRFPTSGSNGLSQTRLSWHISAHVVGLADSFKLRR